MRSTSSSLKPAAAPTAGQPRLALGDRAGLVEDDGVDRGHPLQRLGVADEDAGLGAAAGRDHDRDRRRQAERAGAGDDEHADRRDQRIGERRRRPDREPDDEGDAPRRRSPPARTRPRPGRRGPGSAPASAARSATMATIRASVVSAPVRSTRHVEAARAVDRAAGDAVARALLDRQRTRRSAATRRRRCRPSMTTPSIGHACRRAGRGGRRRPRPSRAAPPPSCRRRRLRSAVFGASLEQGANGAAAPLAGAQLEHLAEEDQRGDHRGRLEIDRHACRDGSASRRGRRRGSEDGDDAVEERRAGADRDQREHVEVAGPDRGGAAREERRAAPEHRRNRKRRTADIAGRWATGTAAGRCRRGARPCRARGRTAASGVGDPEPSRHVEELGIRPLVARRDHRLQRHAADRAAARPVADDLRMHRAGVERPRRLASPARASRTPSARGSRLSSRPAGRAWSCFSHKVSQRDAQIESHLCQAASPGCLFRGVCGRRIAVRQPDSQLAKGDRRARKTDG